MATSIGFQNNNPLNLTYLSNQPGVTGSNGGFGTYSSLQDGIAADYRQMLINQDTHGVNTVAGMVTRWAPPDATGNSTASTNAYISAVSSAMGVGPNDTVDFHDPAIAQRYIAAASAFENGSSTSLDPSTLAAGVAQAQGVPASSIPTMTINPSGSSSTALTTTGGSSTTAAATPNHALLAVAVVGLAVVALLWGGVSGTVKHYA
jgi:hypothetical protein